MIAKMWFQTIIPPRTAPGENIVAGLMVTSISLALGLIIGDAIVVALAGLFGMLWSRGDRRQAPEKSSRLGHQGTTSLLASVDPGASEDAAAPSAADAAAPNVTGTEDGAPNDEAA